MTSLMANELAHNGIEYRQTFSRTLRSWRETFHGKSASFVWPEVFIASALREICYVRKVNHPHRASETHSCPHAIRHAVFSRKTNVTRSDLARSFQRSPDIPWNCHSIRRETSMSICPPWSIYYPRCPVQSPLRPIARIVRRNEIACAVLCAVIAFRCAPSSALRNDVWSSMRYHSREAKRSRKLRSRFDPGKLMQPEISHSVVLTTHLSIECAWYPRVLYALDCSEIARIHQHVGPRQCRTTVLLKQLNRYILSF